MDDASSSSAADPSTASGSKPSRARLVDVARRAGVSRTTVAKVLLNTGGANARVSDKTVERVKEAARALGFRPNPIARQLKGIGSKTIGLLVGYGRATNMLQRILDIEQLVYDRGYKVVLAHAHRDVQRAEGYLDHFESYGVEGLLGLHLPEHFGDAFFDRLRDWPAPVVLQNIHHVPGACNIFLDRAVGTELAVTHLLAAGYERPALLWVGSAEEAGVQAKLRGFRRGLERAGAAFSDAQVIAVDSKAKLDGAAVPRMIQGSAAEGRPIDALICSADSVAIRLLRPLLAAGIRVPQDVGLCGFDNEEAAAWTVPSITSIDQCDTEVARLTVDTMFRSLRLGDPVGPEDSRAISPQLVARESTRRQMPAGMRFQDWPQREEK